MKLVFFKKKKMKFNQNRFKPTGFGSVQFNFLGKNRFKPVWLGFSGFTWFFLVWLGFGSVFSSLGSVQFGFFGFRLIKSKPNRTGQFFQNFNWFNRFFFKVRFFRFFFLVFSIFQFFYSPIVCACIKGS